MIVRNGAATLSACLRSVVAVCEELIVVDTGSDDDSPAIARSFGAKLVHTPWVGDFSAVRNVYLEQAACSWLLSLDADEILGEVNKAEFINALERHPSTAFMFRIRNYFFEGDFPEPTLPSQLSGESPAGFGCVITKTIRLFPRLRGIRYCYPVHESLLPAVRREGVRVKQCAIPIHHMGNLHGRADFRAKAAFYRTLGQKKIAEFPKYFLGYLELGKVYLSDGQLEEAGRMFEHSIRLRPRCVEAHCLLALTLLRRGRHSECRELLWWTSRRFPGNSDVIYLLDIFDRKMQGTSHKDHFSTVTIRRALPKT
jgi:glycosyltransferase involved in cell wall biosynthesis